MAHVGQKLALGTAGRFGGFLCTQEFSFSAFAFGNVHHRANYPDRLSGGVADDVSPIENVYVRTVVAAKLIFAGPAAASSVFDDLPKTARDPCYVFRAQPAGPRLGVFRTHPFGHAYQPGIVLVPPRNAGEEIVVPDNIVCGVCNELKALFAALQGLGGPPGFR